MIKFHSSVAGNKITEKDLIISYYDNIVFIHIIHALFLIS